MRHYVTLLGVGPVLLSLLSGPSSRAQVVTSQFSVAERVSNPAVIVTRGFGSVAFSGERRIEQSNVLNLTNASFTEDLTIDEIRAHASTSFSRDIRAEIDAAFQRGEKLKKNSITSTDYNDQSTSKDNVDLAPVQIVVGRRLNSSFNVGLKGLATLADFKTGTVYRVNVGGGLRAVDAQTELNARLLIFGIGLTYELMPSVFLGSDFNEFKTQRRLKGSYRSTKGTEPTYVSTGDQDVTQVKSVRRDTVGLGTLVGDPKRNAFRAEVSAERISPLTDRAGLNEGRLYRATAEAQWLYFHLGVKYEKSEGYMVDPNNLIPYFLKFEEFSNRAKSDVGFIGGLRSEKGHSFSLFFSSSTERVNEQITSTDSQSYETEIKSQSYGVSYSYLF